MLIGNRLSKETKRRLSGSKGVPGKRDRRRKGPEAETDTARSRKRNGPMWLEW